jgi:hypothetical protein
MVPPVESVVVDRTESTDEALLAERMKPDKQARGCWRHEFITEPHEDPVFAEHGYAKRFVHGADPGA